jgi:hypothetical protein
MPLARAIIYARHFCLSQATTSRKGIDDLKNSQRHQQPQELAQHKTLRALRTFSAILLAHLSLPIKYQLPPLDYTQGPVFFTLFTRTPELPLAQFIRRLENSLFHPYAGATTGTIHQTSRELSFSPVRRSYHWHNSSDV